MNMKQQNYFSSYQSIVLVATIQENMKQYRHLPQWSCALRLVALVVGQSRWLAHKQHVSFH
jgi:hypothetical protein